MHAPSPRAGHPAPRTTAIRPSGHDLRLVCGLAFALFALVCWLGAASADAASPSANLDQCANDPAPSPSTNGCSGAPGENDWVNGNVNGSKANYLEGDSLPYRMKFGNLTLASHTVTIEWDTTKGGKHAIDYITSYDRTVATANPCLGIGGCGASTTFPIPADPQVTGAGVTPVAGAFTLFGGTITAVSAYSGGAAFPGGDNARRISVTFTPTVANPVLAWGGHISTRDDWGAGGSAVTISGSPFHTRLVDLDGSGGSQDRALSADAVTYPGSITITKDATPDGSTSFPFTASPSPLMDFTLIDDGTGSRTMAFTDILDFKTYSVAEIVPAGWSLKGVACTVEGGISTSPPSTTTATVSIALQEGDDVACTYTDERKGATLVVIKHVINDNGGMKAAGDFSMTLTGVTPQSPAPSTFPGAESPGTSVDLSSVGSYAVDEGAHVGYVVAYSADCTGTIAWGETKTCTITNDDIVPILHLRKLVVNDNGGTAKAIDWTLTATGTDGNDLSGATPVDSGSKLKADTWTLSEAGPKGYAASTWDCSGGSQDGAEITVGIGGEATCTITNDDIAPMLHLRKVVVNDNGGTAKAIDWTLTATAVDGSSLSGATPVDSGPTFTSGTWTLSESGPKGYAASTWVCDGGTQDGAKITVAVGTSATCTITNDDIAPMLHLRKLVVNDNGGTAKAIDWTLTATGTDGNDLSGTTPVDSGGTLKADTWTLSEAGPKGYAASTWVCEGGSQDGSEITVGIGGEATCTITNDDVAPILHLRKLVVNDNGGTAAPADWTLTATGTDGNDLSGTTPVDSGGTLKADTWTLSEAGPKGYAASTWVCEGGSQDGSEITVGIGGEATCTITNDDVAPILHLRKLVVNDNGGTAAPADWTLTATGTDGNDLSGTTPVDSGSKLKADTWTLSEDGPAAYEASAWVCDGGSQEGVSIVLTIGQEATCTITNDDIAPMLHLRKLVVNDNGGTAVPADWTLTATGTDGNDLSGTSPVDSGPKLQAGTWTLSEDGPAAYEASAWVCDGGSQEGVSIALTIGQEATCTITNDDIAPILHLRKLVVNANGGTAVPADWTLTATGTDGNDLSGTSPVDSGGTLKADTWALAESGPTGYDASAWVCDGGTQDGASVALTIGQEATCTVTNTQQTGTIQLVKVVSPATNTGLFGLSITGPSFATSVADVGNGGTTGVQTVAAGSYTVAESAGTGTSLASYTSSLTCTADGASVTGLTGLAATTAAVPVGAGQAVVCTFTNTAIVPITPTVAPPVAPVVLPPPAMRGTATLRGAQGCTQPGTVVTRVTGRNMRKVAFFRDGRFIKAVTPANHRLRVVILRTAIAPTDFTMHTVVARVTFVQGATPAAKVLMHRFAQCRSVVTG